MEFFPTPLVDGVLENSFGRASRTVYICICNGFTDRQVRTVCEQQQCRVSDIYKALGCAPKCGKCVPMLKEFARPADPVAALAQSVA